MSLSGKIECLNEIKSPGTVFPEIFGSKKENLPKVCPNNFSFVELLKGNWVEVGCTMLVHCLLEGKLMIMKENVDAVDKENQSYTFNFLEGDLMKLYKSLKISFQITSNGGKNYFKWTYTYKKLNPDVPAPDEILKAFVDEVANKIDQHYLELNNTGQS